MKPQILKEEPISMAELKENVAAIKKRDAELNFRVNKLDEYLNVFVHIDFKKSQELKNKIDKLNIPRLKEQHINKIIDLLPKSVEDLKAVLQAYTISINSANMKRIVDLVKEYSP